VNYPRFAEKDYIGLNGVSMEQLIHPHFQEWQEWFLDKYEAPTDRVCVFLPCAAIKPYYNSPIHKVINSVLEEYMEDIHRVVISNAGVIPYEHCDKYPFDSYDWNPLAEDEHIQEEYYNVTRQRIEDYLSRHSYKAHVSYLRNRSLSFRALRDACKDLKIQLYYSELNEEIPHGKDTDLVLTYDENLERLSEILEGLL
jgi:predicted RNA-binding protein